MEMICISIVAEAVSGIPVSWPGYDLTIGVTGEKCSRFRNSLML